MLGVSRLYASEAGDGKAYILSMGQVAESV